MSATPEFEADAAADAIIERSTATVKAAQHVPPSPGQQEHRLIVLGVLLLIVGFVASIQILLTIGIVVLVIGLVLMALGMAVRAVGGRKRYYGAGRPPIESAGRPQAGPSATGSRKADGPVWPMKVRRLTALAPGQNAGPLSGLVVGEKVTAARDGAVGVTLVAKRVGRGHGVK